MNANIKVQIEQDRLNKKIIQLEEDLRVSCKRVVNEAAAFFIQSVVRETPPKKVAKDNADYTHRMLRHAGGESFRVVIYGNRDPQMKYGKNGQLQRFREVWYRGIGKAGWAFCAKLLQADTPTKVGKFPVGDKIALKEGAISQVGVTNNSSGLYALELTNKVEGISRYGALAIAFALGKAHNRLKSWGAAQFKQTARKSWQA